MTQVGKKSYLSNFVIDNELSYQNGLDKKKIQVLHIDYCVGAKCNILLQIVESKYSLLLKHHIFE